MKIQSDYKQRRNKNDEIGKLTCEHLINEFLNQFFLTEYDKNNQPLKATALLKELKEKQAKFQHYNLKKAKGKSKYLLYMEFMKKFLFKNYERILAKCDVSNQQEIQQIMSQQKKSQAEIARLREIQAESEKVIQDIQSDRELLITQAEVKEKEIHDTLVKKQEIEKKTL